MTDNSGTVITYYNVAKYNKNTSAMVITTSDMVDYASTYPLRCENVLPAKYGSFEKNGMRAGNIYRVFNNDTVGFLSTDISDGSGNFETGNLPYIEFNLNKTISVPGITLFFGFCDWQYCSQVNLTFTLSDDTTSTKTFYPDSNEYFCDLKGTLSTTKVRVEFVKTSIACNRARLYRFELGQITVFNAENDNLITASLRITANLSADEVESNSSTVEVYNTQMYGLGKEQKYTIHHNGNYLSTHYVDEIVQHGNGLIGQKGRFTINGLDIIGMFNEYISPITDFEWNTFGVWIAKYIAATKFDDYPITFDDDSYANINIYGKCDSRIMKRTLLQKLAFAAGCYIDTTVDGTIHIKPLKATLDATLSGNIDETQVFAGDILESKQPYKYIRIKLNNDNYDANRVWSVTNANADGSTAVKEFNLDFIPQDVDGLLGTLKKYYFNSRFYKAKAVIGDQNGGYYHLGSRIKINNVDAYITTLEYNLDGQKLIAQGEYKCHD